MASQLEQLEVTYLSAKLYVEPEDQKEFIRLSPLYARVIHENYGYQLVHASYPTTGEVNLFTHIWKIPKGVAVADVMKATGDQVVRETGREKILEAASTAIARVREELGQAPSATLVDERTLAALLNDHSDGRDEVSSPPVSNHSIHDLVDAVIALLPNTDIRQQSDESDTGSIESKLRSTCGELKMHCERCNAREESLAGYGEIEQKQQVNPLRERGIMSTENAAELLAHLAGQLAKAGLDTLLLAGQSKKRKNSESASADKYADLAEVAIELARQNYQIPGVASPFLKIQSLIQRTEQNLMAALPYDPQLFGHQNQTIFVDAGGALWLMEHEVLREKLKDKRVEEGSSRDQKLRRLLEQGATVATLKGGATGDALLFNLAGIQPKSVFQHRAAPAKGSLEEFKMIPKENSTALPGEVQKIYVASPWGAIYDLDAEAIKEASVSLTVLDEAATATDSEEKAKKSTRHLMGALLEARVPLAAIPEVRDQDIGWGFYCYVINLQSFVREDSHEASQMSR